MADDMEPDDWHSQRRHLQASGQRGQLPSGLRPKFDPRENLQRVSPEDLVDVLTPALVLVGGVGMREEERADWFAAAGIALGHLPEDLLRRGVKAAMRVADHPSKIVAAITAEIGSEYQNRLDHQRRAAEHRDTFDPAKALPAPGQNRATHAEIDAILTEFGIPSAFGRTEQRKHLGPPRNPTTEDYIALGLEPQQARIGAEMVARALLPAPRRDPAKPIGQCDFTSPQQDSPQ